MTEPGWARLHQEVREHAARRRRRAIALTVIGTIVCIGGLAAMFGEYFGSGTVAAVIGFAIATIGQEMDR